MKIIILSNFDCGSDENGVDYYKTDFFSMLNIDGFDHADFLGDRLGVIPDIVFSSPLLCSLQSIYPLCRDNNLKVNVEPALYPVVKNDVLKYNYGILNKHYDYLMGIIEHTYNPSILINNITSKDTYLDTKNRLYPFLFTLCYKYRDTDKVILICTHSDICKKTLQFFDKPIIEYNKKFNNGNWAVIAVPNSKDV